MTRADPQIKLRLPELLKEQIEETARSAGRSMNAEIAARLEASFIDKHDPKEAALALAKEHLATIKERNRAQNYALVLSCIADRIPVGTFKDVDFVEQALAEVRGDKYKLMRTLAQSMLDDMKSAVFDLNENVKSGAIKVTDAKTGRVIPPEEVKPITLPRAKTLRAKPAK